MKSALSSLLGLVILSLPLLLLFGCRGNPNPIYQTPTEELTLAPIQSTQVATSTETQIIPETMETSRPAETNTQIPTSTIIPTPTSDTGWRIDQNPLSADQVRVLLFDKENNLWSAGPVSITRWNLQTGQSITYTDPKLFNDVNDVSMVMKDDAIWVGTYGNGISKFDNNGWVTYLKGNSSLPSDYIGDMTVGQDGTLWIDTYPDPPDELVAENDPTGFGVFDGKKWTKLIGGTFFRIAAAPDGSVWSISWGTNWQSVHHFDGDRWNSIVLGKKPTNATAIEVASDGSIWVANDTGVYRFYNTSWHKIIPPWLGQPVDRVSSIAVEKDGTAWFGLSYGSLYVDKCGGRFTNKEEMGVYRYDGKTWKHYTIDDGLVDNKICDIAIGSDGSVWIGSFDKGISHFDGNVWTSYQIR